MKRGMSALLLVLLLLPIAIPTGAPARIAREPIPQPLQVIAKQWTSWRVTRKP